MNCFKSENRHNLYNWYMFNFGRKFLSGFPWEFSKKIRDIAKIWRASQITVSQHLRTLCWCRAQRAHCSVLPSGVSPVPQRGKVKVLLFHPSTFRFPLSLEYIFIAYNLIASPFWCSDVASCWWHPIWDSIFVNCTVYNIMVSIIQFNFPYCE